MAQTDICHFSNASGLSRDITAKRNNFARPRRRKSRKNGQAPRNPQVVHQDNFRVQIADGDEAVIEGHTFVLGVRGGGISEIDLQVGGVGGV